MAKIKVRPRPGALSELLKKRRMTQVDAFEKTRVDRKTLSRIDRGEEVKLETLQQVANKLQVPEGYFNHPASSAADDIEVSSAALEPGTIMLRKLDWAHLEKLLTGAETIRWHLKAPVRDTSSRKFLEEFEQAVEDFRKLLKFNIPEAWDGDPSLRFQLNRLQVADDIAARLEKLADHGVALLGADYLFWDSESEDGEYLDGRWINVNYRSSRTLLLSVDPVGAQARRTPIFQGTLPPRLAPKPYRNIRTNVRVNGAELPAYDDSDLPF